MSQTLVGALKVFGALRLTFGPSTSPSNSQGVAGPGDATPCATRLDRDVAAMPLDFQRHVNESAADHDEKTLFV